MNSTKTIVLGKKRSKRIKKRENIKDFLNDYIPRFTDEDIPKEDLLIDNSFELKKYTSKKNIDTLQPEEKNKHKIESNSNKPSLETPTEHTIIQSNSDKPSLETPTEHAVIRSASNNSPSVQPVSKSIFKHIPEKSPVESSTEHISTQKNKELQLQTIPTTVTKKKVQPHTPITNNIEDIVYNYNKQKYKDRYTYKPFDTVSTQSSILDIMSMADMDTNLLEKIKKNISTTKTPIKNKIKTEIHTPSYNKTFIHSSKLHKQTYTGKKTHAQDNKKYNTYNNYYNKYYSSIKNKEVIYNKNDHKKLNNSIKQIKITNISTIRQILFTHKIISKKDIYMPDAMILDLYAMLSDKNCKFNIKQFT